MRGARSVELFQPKICSAALRAARVGAQQVGAWQVDRSIHPHCSRDHDIMHRICCVSVRIRCVSVRICLLVRAFPVQTCVRDFGISVVIPTRLDIPTVFQLILGHDETKTTPAAIEWCIAVTM